MLKVESRSWDIRNRPKADKPTRDVSRRVKGIPVDATGPGKGVRRQESTWILTYCLMAKYTVRDCMKCTIRELARHPPRCTKAYKALLRYSRRRCESQSFEPTHLRQLARITAPPPENQSKYRSSAHPHPQITLCTLIPFPKEPITSSVIVILLPNLAHLPWIDGIAVLIHKPRRRRLLLLLSSRVLISGHHAHRSLLLRWSRRRWRLRLRRILRGCHAALTRHVLHGRDACLTKIALRWRWLNSLLRPCGIAARDARVVRRRCRLLHVTWRLRSRRRRHMIVRSIVRV